MNGSTRRSTHDIDLWTRAFAAEQARQAGISVRAWLEEFVARETARAAADAPTHGRAGGPDDPAAPWRPAWSAFGQRAGDATQSAEASHASAIAILARSVDDAYAMDTIDATPAERSVEDGERADELGVRARVGRRSEHDEIEQLQDAPAPQTDAPIVAEPPLSEVERALQEMRKLLDAAGRLVDPAPSDEQAL